MKTATVRRSSAATARLKQGLDELRLKYEREHALGLDPITVPLRFADPADRELAAWVAASLAYGKVAPMLRAIDAALAPLGERPAAWLRARTEAQARRALAPALAGWAWRFHTADDLVHWLLAWKRLDASGGLESHFLPGEGEPADAALSRLVQRLRLELPESYGLRFNLPDPAEGSACKRWRMFLRWMARSAWPDLGLWTRYPAAELVMPLDTHVARVSRYIGLSSRATSDGAMAAEVSRALAALEPGDPLAYDFALSHLGILGDCPGVKQRPHCLPCPLYKVCRAGRQG
ncbi:MAG TPA: TIGR02757 family protein [Holophagaceae bacterium]|nr:TIGR02757 family protein [Holophagaceae bacterium]